MNTAPLGIGHVFTDLTFSCNGQLAQWDIFAKQSGIVYAGIWRKVAEGKYFLVDSNRLNVTKEGRQVYTFSTVTTNKTILRV